MWRRTIDPGLGEEYNSRIKRLINKDGTFNTVKLGRELRLYDAYQYLKNVSVQRLSFLILGFYLLINILFALLYLLCGIENLQGTEPDLPPFLNAFFFSVQTFTTVGYGILAPQGMAMNLVVTLESLMGWVGFAIITGVVFSRFSKPHVRILYSNNAIIAPHEGEKSLQFRLANKRNNVLLEMEAKVMLMVHDATYEHQFYNLKLEQSSLQFFPLNWTIVHHIDKDSPLYNIGSKELEEQRAEVIILIKGYDEAYGQTVHSRFSYRFDEILWDVRFKKVYDTDAEGEIVFDLHKLHETEPVSEPAL
ncbi:ion channel [Pontibacter pamirensis]|uniref:ion channel n=1 Tax=Pontibacter pamirensis TaxID=2562824 RepID=UPI0013897597|nr:ion channel [Pontibacter pamirensis]